MPGHDIGYCENRCGYRVKRESGTYGRTGDLTYPLHARYCPTCTPRPTRDAAEELARSEYPDPRRGDRHWLVTSRGADADYHLRAMHDRRADADADTAARRADLVARILDGRATTYRTASGRWELP